MTTRISVQRGRILTMCLLIAGLVLVLDHASPLLSRVELMTLDWRFVARGPRKPGPDVVVVGIDEKSQRLLGPFPWPRSFHAALVRTLHECGAAGVVFDISFTEPRGDKEDAEFADAIHDAGNVVLAAGYIPPETMGHGENMAQRATAQGIDPGMARVRSSVLMRARSPDAPKPLPGWLPPPSRETFWDLPIPALLEAAYGTGYVQLPADPDAVYRRAGLLQPVDNGALYAHLAVVAAALKLGVSPREIRPEAAPVVHVGSARSIPLSDGGAVIIDFTGPAPTEKRPPMFPRYSYSDVLALGAGERSPVRPETFRGKLVFVGMTQKGRDVFRSPYSPDNSGVETNASLTNTILQSRFFRQPGSGPLLLILAGVGLTLGILLSVPSLLRSTLLALLAGGVYVLLALKLFNGPRIVLPMAGPLAVFAFGVPSVLAYRFQTEYRQRLRDLGYLELYVTRPVAERILNDPAAASLGGQRAEITVLFADIQDFTTVAAELKPEEVIALLNEYFERLVPAIMEQDGLLVQYVGDEIMGLWGSPIEQPDHAARAVRAGLAMVEAYRELRAEWEARGMPPLELRIGINSGRAVAGNMGSSKRAQYTVVGDTVNTAARIKTLCEECHVPLIISEDTRSLAPEVADLRPLPPATVKGKAQPLTVYEVVGPKGAVREALGAAGRA